VNSSKPYLVRALYEWILDNDTTPYILVDTSSDEVLIPPGIANDGKVVLNLAPAAIENLEMTNEQVSFSARFNGVAENIFCPITSLLAIYARENGEGMNPTTLPSSPTTPKRRIAPNPRARPSKSSSDAAQNGVIPDQRQPRKSLATDRVACGFPKKSQF
jgi:stringent starvation protein B